MTNETNHPILDDSDEERPSVDWEKSVAVTIAVGAGMLVLIAAIALAILLLGSLLGPQIGTISSGYLSAL